MLSHAFYPLIHQVILTRRYKKIDDSINEKTRAHSYFNINGIFKVNSKQRKIYYANHIDSQIYSFYANEILSIKYEKALKLIPGLSDCISAYRRIPTLEDSNKNKGNIHFAKDVFDEIKRRQDCVAIAFDISEFFDSIDHEILKKAWSNLLGLDKLPNDHYNIFKSLTNFSYVKLDSILKELNIKHPNEIFRKGIHEYFNSRKDFKKQIKEKNLIKKHPFKNKTTGLLQGIPQGTPISAFLANLYLLNFDINVLKEVQSLDGFYRRYSDDIVIICSKENYTHLKKFVLDHIQDFKLEIQDAKTQARLFVKDRLSQILKVYELFPDESLKENIPFEYLGFEFNGVKPLLKKASINKFYREAKSYSNKRIRAAAKENKFKYTQPNIHKRVFKRKIYKLFTHLGSHGKRRNFILYANEASIIFNEPAIKNQLSKSWNKINDYLMIKIQKKKIEKFNLKILSEKRE